ncbi:MAG: FAD-binding oxidoreductase [Cyclobacteriaceae bacterium]|nr:FAD-binding oxidoreductase [Cyclobacteriaceae bacterium]
MKNLVRALTAWKKVLKLKNQIITDSHVLQKFSTATFKTKQKVVLVLKPRSAQQVSDVLKIATRFGVPISPVSGGKNWGLGSAVPGKDAVLLDLSGLNKITDYNEDMAYLTVQAGVTFRQAVAYLEKKNSTLMLDTLGSTPDASIVGNTCERGHGMALHADRFNFVCGMQVVLPSGDVIHTGFEAWQSSALGPLAKWGLGPYIDGLFTQSALGVVTQLTIWLKPKTKFFQSFMFHVNADEKLPALMEKLRMVSLQGLPVSLRVFNETRMFSFSGRFPANQKKPLSDRILEQMCAEKNIGRWVGIGGLYAVSKAHAQADKIFLEEILKNHVENLQFFDDDYVEEHYDKATQQEKQTMDFMVNRSLLRGNVSEAGLNMVYWRKPESIVISDLHSDKCGVQWYCPAIPFTGKAVKETVAICRRISAQHGFELNLGFLFINARTLDVTGAICYDREVTGDDAKAQKCHNEILNVLAKKGFTPYRLGIQSMYLLKHLKPFNRKFLNKLKQMIDPSCVLNPGKYFN